MSLCRNRGCGCSFTSSSLKITGDGTPFNIEGYEAVATEFPDTRPGPGVRFEGMRVWTSDTKRLFLWDDTLGKWLTLDEPWQAFTSATSNITLGTGGTAVGRYKRRYNEVHCYGAVTLGTGGSFSSTPLVGLPIPAAAAAYGIAVATAHFHDYLIIRMAGLGIIDASSGKLVFMNNAGFIAPTYPFTWGANDQLTWDFVYEVAP